MVGFGSDLSREVDCDLDEDGRVTDASSADQGMR